MKETLKNQSMDFSALATKKRFLAAFIFNGPTVENGASKMGRQKWRCIAAQQNR